MRRVFRPVVRFTAVAIVAYAGLAWYIARRALASKRKPIEVNPMAFGLPFEEVAFRPRGASLTLRGWYIPAARVPKGTIVVVHGLYNHRAPRELRRLELACHLHDAGFNLLLFDLRAHGESDGTRHTLGYHEANDVLGALDFVTRVKREAWERVGVLGFSLGAVSSLLAADREPLLRAIVADSAFADLHEIIVARTARHAHVPGLVARLLVAGAVLVAHLRYGVLVHSVTPVKAIGRLDFAVFLIHGGGDGMVPVHHARRLKEAAQHIATELWVVSGAGHIRAYLERPLEYVNRVTGYFITQFAPPESNSDVASVAAPA
ncbi:MAG: alpha/beta fold hydrolase [Chloroflexi bacterium]|nr:alpha/beta fold hydrolase [Chloroflexota bacterium]